MQTATADSASARQALHPRNARHRGPISRIPGDAINRCHDGLASLSPPTSNSSTRRLSFSGLIPGRKPLACGSTTKRTGGFRLAASERGHFRSTSFGTRLKHVLRRCASSSSLVATSASNVTVLRMAAS